MNLTDQLQAIRAKMWRDIRFIIKETEEQINKIENETKNTPS